MDVASSSLFITWTNPVGRLMSVSVREAQLLARFLGLRTDMTLSVLHEVPVAGEQQLEEVYLFWSFQRCSAPTQVHGRSSCT